MITGVRVFDTVLDSSNIKDTAGRNSADFWRPFCKSAGWDFAYERIHSLADLEYFFSKKIKENVIIFSGHGNKEGFYLSNGDVFDKEINGAFPEKNHGKTIIFSSCLMGKNDELCQELKSFFNADFLFAYRHLMEDRFCFLHESILLTVMQQHSTKKFTPKDFEYFRSQTAFMKNMNQKHVKQHPMVCF